MGLIVGVFAAFAATTLLIPVVSRLAFRFGWVDEPDSVRKKHARPTPSVGGIAIAAGFAIGFGLLFLFPAFRPVAANAFSPLIWLGAIAVVATGFYDDTKGLGFKGKFIVQIAVAYLLMHAGLRVEVGDLPFVETDAFNHALYSIPLTFIWVVGLMNAVNLIDGLDGLAAGASLISLFCLSVVFGLQGNIALIAVALVLGAALIGFLVHNYNPATIFMGDSGSLPLGYMLAVFSLSGTAHTDPWLTILIPVVALGFPVADTALSIVRRFVERKPICAPDHDHIHHRLTRLFSKKTSVNVLYGVSLALGGAAILMSVLPPMESYTVLTITATLSVIGIGFLGYHTRPGAVEEQDASRPVRIVHRITSSGDGHDSRVGLLALSEPAHGDGSAARSNSDDLEVLPSQVRGILETQNGALPEGLAPKSTTRSIDEPVNESTVVVIGEELTSADLGDESVVLDLKSGQYYGLNEVGARILQIVREPKSIGDIVEQLSRHYDVERDHLRADVFEFLSELKTKNLIRVNSESVA